MTTKTSPGQTSKETSRTAATQPVFSRSSDRLELGVWCADDAVRLRAEDLPDPRGRDERLADTAVAGHAADISTRVARVHTRDVDAADRGLTVLGQRRDTPGFESAKRRECAVAFEELTTKHAQVWVLRTVRAGRRDHHRDARRPDGAPRAAGGEHWLDLGCGTGDVAFHAARAGAVVTGSDLSLALIETAQHQASELGLDLTLEVADCQALHYTGRVVRRRLVVGRRDLRARSPARRRRTRPRMQARRPNGDRVAPRQRRGRHLRRDVEFMPPPPEGAGSPFQWGEEAYVEERLGNTYELSFEELDTRHEHDDPAEMWELFRTSYGPSHVLWGSLDEERRRELGRDHDGGLRAAPGRRRDQHGAPLHRRHGRAEGVAKPTSQSRASPRRRGCPARVRDRPSSSRSRSGGACSLPRVGARLAAPAGRLFAAEGAADLGAAGTDVDVRDPAVGAGAGGNRSASRRSVVKIHERAPAARRCAARSPRRVAVAQHVEDRANVSCATMSVCDGILTIVGLRVAGVGPPSASALAADDDLAALVARLLERRLMRSNARR